MSDNISVILTIWKRDHLEEQIEALLNQSIEPSEIWVYHCCRYQPINTWLIQKYPKINYQFNSADLGYFGRFSLGLCIKNPYLLIIDDDVIPSKDWIEMCLNKCKKYTSIISPIGRRILRNDYFPELLHKEGIFQNQKFENSFIGNSMNKNFSYCFEDTFIDFGCNSWFFKTEWLKYFWGLQPLTLKTGEDIHFSAACKILGDINTICPRQDHLEITGNLKMNYGFDENASFRNTDFIEDRNKILHYLIDDCDWKPILW